jgi:hypothetical protein
MAAHGARGPGKSKSHLEILMKVRESHDGSVGAFMRLIGAACIAGVVLTTVGCSMLRTVNPLSTTVSLFNNSGRTVLVSNKEVAPGKKINVKYLRGSRDRLFVFSAGCVFSFSNLPALPDDFESGSPFGADYQAQLEGDGRIFLVRPGVRRPVDVAAGPAQPPGFPLTPSRGSGCQPEETQPAGSAPAASPDALAPAPLGSASPVATGTAPTPAGTPPKP